jgi:hypothetical protein
MSEFDSIYGKLIDFYLYVNDLSIDDIEGKFNSRNEQE